jgi:lipopolysaccharide export LptBFGC system permease protein LptF
MNKYAAVILYGISSGTLLTLFSIIPGLNKYIFSLAALYLGFRFFRNYESLKARISFVVLSLLFFFLSIIVYVAVAVAKGWNIPGVTDKL